MPLRTSGRLLCAKRRAGQSPPTLAPTLGGVDQVQGSSNRSVSPPSGLRPDANDVKTVRAGLERSDHRRSDAQNVPLRELDHFVIELGTTGTADHDVGLLLLAVPVTPRHSGAWLVGEAAHAKLWRFPEPRARTATGCEHPPDLRRGGRRNSSSSNRAIRIPRIQYIEYQRPSLRSSLQEAPAASASRDLGAPLARQPTMPATCPERESHRGDRDARSRRQAGGRSVADQEVGADGAGPRIRRALSPAQARDSAGARR